MEETLELKKLYIKEVTVNGDLLYPNGVGPDEWYPDSPFALTINYKDFSDPEDYRTVIRLLTQAAKKKISAPKVDAR